MVTEEEQKLSRQPVGLGVGRTTLGWLVGRWVCSQVLPDHKAETEVRRGLIFFLSDSQFPTPPWKQGLPSDFEGIHEAEGAKSGEEMGKLFRSVFTYSEPIPFKGSNSFFFLGCFPQTALMEEAGTVLWESWPDSQHEDRHFSRKTNLYIGNGMDNPNPSILFQWSVLQVTPAYIGQYFIIPHDLVDQERGLVKMNYCAVSCGTGYGGSWW